MSLEAWKKSIDAAYQDDVCFKWDNQVRTEVEDYNRRLAKTPGYVFVDWRIVLAMLWVESGPWSPDWNARVMQFANPNSDAGYLALKKHEGATELVVRKDRLDEIDKALTVGRAAFNDPVLNIKAGIAYLFERMSLSAPGSVADPGDTSLHKHVFSQKNDGTGSSVAQSEGTTLEELRHWNPGVNLDRIPEGTTLGFHKAHDGRKITGWRTFDAKNIAARYNGTGDVFYAEKLRYVYAKLTAGSGAAAASGHAWIPSTAGHTARSGGGRAW